MSGFSFGPDGTSKCESCGEEFNSFTSYDIAGKFCNKCNDAKLNPKQDLEQDSKQESEKESEQDSEQDEEQESEKESEKEPEKEPEKDMFGFPVKGTKKGKDKGMFGFGGM